MKTMNKIFLILFLIFSPLGASASDIDQAILLFDEPPQPKGNAQTH